jgi:hypothetical protein
MLGYQQNFTVATQILAPGATNELVTDVGILPSYK